MRQIVMVRDVGADPDGLFGKLSTGTFECYTVENREKAFPPGIYRFDWRSDSPAHGACYEAEHIQGRSNIQIHVANWADELEGCIGLGAAIMDITSGEAGKKRGVSSSVATIERFVRDMGKLPFNLEVS